MQPAQTIAPQTSTSQGSSVGSATEQVPQCASSSASPGSSDASCHAAPRPQPRHSRRRAAPSGPRPRRLRARRRRSRGRPIPRDSDGRGERSPAPGTPDGRDERAPEAGRARGRTRRECVRGHTWAHRPAAPPAPTSSRTASRRVWGVAATGTVSDGEEPFELTVPPRFARVCPVPGSARSTSRGPRPGLTSDGFEASLKTGSHWQPSRRGASLRSANVHPKHGRLSTSFARAAVAPRPAPGAATPPPSPRPPGTRASRKLPIPAPPDALRGCPDSA